MTPEEIRKMSAVMTKAQELLDTMYPDTDYRLSVGVCRRDGKHDHNHWAYVLGKHEVNLDHSKSFPFITDGDKPPAYTHNIELP